MPTKESNKLFTHRLKEGATTISIPGRRGDWHTSKNLIQSIAEGTETGSSLTQDIINSTPTTWARPLFFKDALLDPDHPAHQSVRDEWYGLLAMLALNKIFGFDIKIESVDLSTMTERSRTMFMPSQPLGFDGTIQLIYSSGRLIGGLSPQTLVFSAPSYSLNSHVVPWLGVNGRLNDPVGGGCLTVEIQHKLMAWSDSLQAILNDKTLPQELENRNAVVGLLTGWSKDRPRAETLGDLEYYEVGGSFQSIFMHFKGTSIERSISPLGLKKGLKPAIIVTDPENLLASGLDPDAVKPLGTVSERAVFLGLKTGERSGDYLQGQSVHWICPERLFFTEKILRFTNDVKPENVRVGVNPDFPYLPPLTKEICQYLSIHDILVTYSKSGPDSVRCSLRIDTNEKDILIHKTYAKTQIVTCSSSPHLAIWPNFRHKALQRYFTYFSSHGKDASVNFKCRPLRILKEKWIGEEGTDDRAYCSVSDAFPEIIEVANYKDNQPFGLIFPTVGLGQSEELAKTWTVGIDFGTSNTVIACKKTEGSSEILNVRDHTLRILSRPDTHATSAARQFLYWPDRSERLPMPTLFHQNSAVLGDDAILDGIAIFMHDILQWNDLSTIRLFDDLKWSSDERTYPATRLFFTNLLYVIIVEAIYEGIGSASIRWAYPSALPKHLVENTREYIEGLINIEKKGIGITAKSERSFDLQLDSQHSGVTESVAVAEYFERFGRTYSASTTTLAVFMDIGGGTTDISVKNSSKILLQSSVRFAGNLLAHICDVNGRVWSEICEASGQNVSKTSALSKTQVINSILQTSDLSGKIEGPYRMKAGIKLMRTALYMQFSGLFFYVAQLLAAVKQYADLSGIQQVQVRLCGNGSKQVNWVGTELINAIRQIIQSELQGRKVLIIDIQFSNEPKKEVCLGMVGLRQVMSEVPAPTVVAGEAWKMEDNSLRGREQNLTYEDVRNFKELQSSTGLEIERFLKLLRTMTPQSLNEDRLNLKINQTEMNDYVSTEISNMVKKRLERDAILDPFFLIELRYLVDCVVKGEKRS